MKPVTFMPLLITFITYTVYHVKTYEYQNPMLCLTSENMKPLVWQIPTNAEFQCNKLKPNELEAPRHQKLQLFI